MNRYLLVRDGGQALEDGVHVARVVAEIEDRVERCRVEALADLSVGPHELGKVELLFPGAHRMSLHQPVRVVARKPRIDEREQQALAEEEPPAELEVAA